MAQQLLQPESVLLTSTPLPLDLITKVSSLSRIQLKELGEGAPQSPLTESSTSSQESSAAELLEHSSARSILALGSKSSGFSPHTDLDLLTPSPGSGSVLERSRVNGQPFSFMDIPSPNSSFQDKFKGHRGHRPGRGGFQGEQHNLSRNRNNSYRHLFKQVTKIGSGQSLVDMGFPEAALTVEHLVSVVKSLPANQPVVPAVAHGLHFMDSRAVAALLKDIAKNGLPQRAIEIFDWLRNLLSSHELYHLCDVYTYTTVIALCGQRQSLRLALELVAEMRSRGVACNVHTYSALMNTCIKCGELELALDVFNQLQKEGCVANVVTFNTLVDVYGKLGRWQDAIRVLDQLYLQGLEPEPRTFNTVIIAANMCNQPLEALQVYDRMVQSGFRPTATTYTALISAYGKAGQLDNALDVFNQMIQQGCERNIITYGSLISACDRAGRWQYALELLEEMRKDRVAPNTVTYNSLLSACAQGGQSEKAEGLFHSMVDRRCKPDASTYNALVLAHIRAGHWRAALQALESMQRAGNRPEPALYASLVQCLWDSAVPAAQAQAGKLFVVGCRSGAVLPPLQQNNKEDRTLEVAFTAPNSSIAILALHKWLRETQERLEVKGEACLGRTTALVTGCNNSDDTLVTDDATVQLEIQTGLATMLEGMKSHFRADVTAQQQLRLVANSWEIGEWLQREETKAAILDYVPLATPDARTARDTYASRTIAAQEATTNARLAESHALFCQAETHQEHRMAAAEAMYAGTREECLKLANELAKRYSISLEAVYRAMILLDFSLVAGMPYSLGGAAALVAACLTVAARFCGSGNAAVQHSNGMENALGLSAGTLLSFIDQLQRLGVADTPIASPLTALNRYLGHLGQDTVNEHAKPEMPPTPRAKARLAGNSKRLLTVAMADASTQFVRPSLLAAAALAVDRKARGLVPVWPASLRRWTGIAGPEDPALDAAMQAVAAVPAAVAASPKA